MWRWARRARDLVALSDVIEDAVDHREHRAAGKRRTVRETGPGIASGREGRAGN